MRSLTLFFAFVLLAGSQHGQTTAFKYQGSLTDGGSQAKGSFQMQFRLFDAVSGGSQIGTTLNDVPVTAADGTFSVLLDFGSSVFNGGGRWLEIAIRRNSGESYITLNPREQVTSTPYGIRTISAVSADSLSNVCIGCVQDGNIDSVSGTKVTGTVANAANSINAANAGSAATAGNASNLGGLPPSRYVQSDPNGDVGIGTAPASGSKLTVGGQLQITSGAVKFPDSTPQSSAGLAAVSTSGPLTGNGTANSPLGITTPLIIKDSDRPTRQIVNSGFPYTVPAGKVLVVEFVTARTVLVTDPSIPPLLEIINDFNQPFPPVYHAVPTRTWIQQGTSRTYVFTDLVKIYIPSEIILNVRSNFTLVAPKFSGYLVDEP
jgi:hypothetical protein